MAALYSAGEVAGNDPEIAAAFHRFRGDVLFPYQTYQFPIGWLQSLETLTLPAVYKPLLAPIPLIQSEIRSWHIRRPRRIIIRHRQPNTRLHRLPSNPLLRCTDGPCTWPGYPLHIPQALSLITCSFSNADISSLSIAQSDPTSAPFQAPPFKYIPSGPARSTRHQTSGTNPQARIRC